jgi:hypothetical protein
VQLLGMRLTMEVKNIAYRGKEGDGLLFKRPSSLFFHPMPEPACFQAGADVDHSMSHSRSDPPAVMARATFERLSVAVQYDKAARSGEPRYACRKPPSDENGLLKGPVSDLL